MVSSNKKNHSGSDNDKKDPTSKFDSIISQMHVEQN